MKYQELLRLEELKKGKIERSISLDLLSGSNGKLSKEEIAEILSNLSISSDKAEHTTKNFDYLADDEYNVIFCDDPHDMAKFLYNITVKESNTEIISGIYLKRLLGNYTALSRELYFSEGEWKENKDKIQGVIDFDIDKKLCISRTNWRKGIKNYSHTIIVYIPKNKKQ